MTQSNGISLKVARRTQTQRTDTAPVASPPASQPVEGTEDAYIQVAAAPQPAEPVQYVKLAVLLSGAGLDRSQQKSIASEIQALRGIRVLDGDGPITLGAQRPLIVEVQEGSVAVMRKRLEKIESVSVVSLTAIGTEHTELGSTDPQDILKGLQSPACSERIETARSLANRLRAEGRRFTGSDEQRNQLGDAIFHLSSELAGIFNRLESDSHCAVTEALHAAAEDEAEPSLDWDQLNRRVMKQVNDPVRFPELSAVREVIKDLSEVLSRLNTPRSLAMLDQVMVAAHAAGTSRIKGIKGASERLFTAWLNTAQNRIDRSAEDALSKATSELNFTFRNYGNLRAGRTSKTLMDPTWDSNAPFRESTNAPLLLLTGPKGHQLQEQWVDFVLRNESLIETQAATIQDRAVQEKVEPIRQQLRQALESFKEAPADQVECLQNDFERILADKSAEALRTQACSGYVALDSVIKGLRAARYLTRGPAEESRYIAAVLPLYAKLLDQVQSPRLLALVVDEAVSVLREVDVKEEAQGRGAFIAFAAQDLETRLKPFVEVQRIERAWAKQDVFPEEKGKAGSQYLLQVLQTYDQGLDTLSSESLQPLLRQEALAYVAYLARQVEQQRKGDLFASNAGLYAADEAVQAAMEALKNKASVETAA